MNKAGFLRILRNGLAGLHAPVIEEILADYSAYFDKGLASGRSEENVAAALLGRLIAKETGEPLLAYCRQVPFDPMGFGPVAWARGWDGEYRAASGLRLLPRDLVVPVHFGLIRYGRGAYFRSRHQ